MGVEYLHTRRYTNRKTLITYVLAVCREAYSPDCLVAKFPDGHVICQRATETAAEFKRRVRREACGHQ